MPNSASLLALQFSSACNSGDAVPTDAIDNKDEVCPASEILAEEQDFSSTQEVVPRFRQYGNSCAVASALSAVYIWDRMDSTTKRLLAVLAGINATTRGLVGGNTLIEAIENDLKTLGIDSFDDADYKIITEALLTQYDQDGDSYLNISERQEALIGMGFTYTFDPSPLTFTDLMSNANVQSLGKRGMVQLTWQVNNSIIPHSFLVGRDQTGMWFLYDQGAAPAYVRYEDSLSELTQAVITDAQSGVWWLGVNQSPIGAGEGVIPLPDVWQ